MSFEEAEIQANLCHMFSNVYRVLIIWALDGRELSVGRLANEIEATQQNTSQHLRLMKARGFVKSRRKGSKILYTLTPKAYSDAFCLLTNHTRNQID